VDLTLNPSNPRIQGDPGKRRYGKGFASVVTRARGQGDSRPCRGQRLIIVQLRLHCGRCGREANDRIVSFFSFLYPTDFGHSYHVVFPDSVLCRGGLGFASFVPRQCPGNEYLNDRRTAYCHPQGFGNDRSSIHQRPSHVANVNELLASTTWMETTMSFALPPEMLDLIVDHLHDQPPTLKDRCLCLQIVDPPPLPILSLYHKTLTRDV
jgi:hypothetical protein